MAPLVFVINGVTKGNWLEALLFAVAVAVGLMPEPRWAFAVAVDLPLAQGYLIGSVWLTVGFGG